MGDHDFGIDHSTGDEVYRGRIAPSCISDSSPDFQVADADSSNREVDDIFTHLTGCKYPHCRDGKSTL